MHSRKVVERVTILCVITVGCLLNACAQKTEGPPADVKALQALDAQCQRDVGAKDIDKALSYYSDDAVVMWPDIPLLQGKAAIRGLIAAVFADPNLAIKWKTESIVVAKSGDFAYLQGSGMITATDPKTGKPATKQAKYLTVYRKQADGSWKAVEDINNADGPAVSAP